MVAKVSNKELKSDQEIDKFLKDFSEKPAVKVEAPKEAKKEDKKPE